MSDATHVRGGFSAVRSYVFGPLSLATIVERAFGARELGRHEVGPNAFHLEFQIGDSVLVMELADPPHASGMPGSTYVYVPDVDASHAAALAAGASEVSAPEAKPYGERQSGVRDEYGNIWWIATFDH
ncbi:MAG: VOC family protein [Myxococcota bacterium]